MGETFLGFNSIFWQFVNGFLTTIIIGVCMGIVSSKWLNKRELINAEEGRLLKLRVDRYMELLDFMATLENKKIILDADFKLRDQLLGEGFVIRRDRSAVEYWPMFESFQSFKKNFEKLDSFYKENLSLMDPTSAKELTFTYGMFSQIYQYYMYLSSVKMADGTNLTTEEIEDILEKFYPKLGMVLDADLSVMQGRLEGKLVKGLYKFRFSVNKGLFTEEKCADYFVKRYSRTDFALWEKELFLALIREICVKKNVDLREAGKLFTPNDYVKTYDWRV
ncbi:MAG: hypothetical protein IJ419_01625 [Agathobacter sp.]|nr:hypothetical protein [Agathobacter sp.]